MKLKNIYDFFIQEGIRADLRPTKTISEQLRSQKKKYSGLVSREKKFFDKETFQNPYADTRILYGENEREIENILVGIDIDGAELLLADKMAERGVRIDLVLAHHPRGVALAGLDDVMRLQVDLLVGNGIDAKVAEALMSQRIEKIARSVHSSNHQRAVDAAKILDIPLMCCHTPADNHVASYLQKLMDRQKPKNLKKVVSLLMKEPEYQQAARNQAGPKIVVGKPENKAGKVFVDMTGGTEGSEHVFARLSQAGISTQLSMHMSEHHFNIVKKEFINVVVAGHIASDNLGLNLLLDKLEKKGRIRVFECSGFKRVRR